MMKMMIRMHKKIRKINKLNIIDSIDIQSLKVRSEDLIRENKVYFY